MVVVAQVLGSLEHPILHKAVLVVAAAVYYLLVFLGSMLQQTPVAVVVVVETVTLADKEAKAVQVL
jgi:hypothetical protein